jgi:LysM repeat protein
VEKKAVFYKIKMDLKTGVKPPATDSPAPVKQIIEDKPMLAEKKIDPPQLIASVEKRVVETPPTKEKHPEEVQFWRYNAKKEDTLWDIAKKYYGKGAYYPVLLEHNPHVGLYTIGTGVTLNILKNGENASKIYKKIIIRKDGHFFWRYSVAAGDTLQAIIQKYYKKGQAKSDIPNVDKSSELKPGEKIWILIE